MILTLSIEDFYETKSKIHDCFCENARCSGKYIQVYEDQITCLFTYYEQRNICLK